MTIRVACQCGKAFAAQPYLAGKRVACPSCGSPINIPTAQDPTTPAPAISVTCQCGKRFGVKSNLAGKRVKCPACQQPVQIPNTSSAPVPQRAAPVPQPVAPLQSPQVNDDLWSDLPMSNFSVPAAQPQVETMAATNSALANQLLNNARAEKVEQKKDISSWGTGQIFSGIGMMVGAVVWFFAGLAFNRIFFYPPILFVFGVVALIKGILQKVQE